MRQLIDHRSAASLDTAPPCSVAVLADDVISACDAALAFVGDGLSAAVLLPGAVRS